jgi:hypothetical protein
LLGGSGADFGTAIAVDAAGNAYITGYTRSPDFPVTWNAQQQEYGAVADRNVGFLAELAAGGSVLSYATYLGGSGEVYVEGIAVGAGAQASVVYVTGETDSTDLPATPGAPQDRHAGDVTTSDSFVLRVLIPARPLPALNPVSPPSGSQLGVRYFPVTHHTVHGAFLTFFNRHGGVGIFGNPLSEVFSEGGQSVEYFERARLALAGRQISVSALGALLTDGRRFPRIPAFSSTATKLYFPGTGHALSGRFLAFWQAHQGSLVFGPPISEPLREQNGDGTRRAYLVQYFRNARLEYHPELHGTPYEVSVGLLGIEYLHRLGLL